MHAQQQTTARGPCLQLTVHVIACREHNRCSAQPVPAQGQRQELWSSSHEQGCSLVSAGESGAEADSGFIQTSALTRAGQLTNGLDGTHVQCAIAENGSVRQAMWVLAGDPHVLQDSLQPNNTSAHTQGLFPLSSIQMAMCC